MIRHFEHAAIDKKKWDEAICKSSNAMVYAYSWFLDVVSPGWNALIENDYACVFPLTWRKKYGYQYLYQPFFTQQLGVFSNDEHIETEKFLHAIPSSYRLIEIQLNASNTCQAKDFKSSVRLTHHLDLSGSHAKIQSSYSENLKRNIKRAVNSEIKISKEKNAHAIIQLFRTTKGKEISQLKEHDYEILKRLIGEAGKKNLVTILGAQISGESLCAGAVFLHSDHEYIFLFSAADEKARETGAMSLLIDAFIQEHCNSNMQLDFEGSMDSNLARFYKSFGSKEVVYLQIKKNNLPFYIQWFKK
jgi:hypothetical protein